MASDEESGTDAARPSIEEVRLGPPDRWLYCPPLGLVCFFTNFLALALYSRLFKLSLVLIALAKFHFLNNEIISLICLL